MKKLKVVLIGAGQRGITYTEIMKKMPEQFDVVAVAEPIANRRNYIKQIHNIPDDMCFDDYEPLLQLGKIADVAIIATMDRKHYDATIKAINLKYDLLLEKPIAPTAEECIQITKLAEKNNAKVIICTVLRYSDMFVTLKRILDEGKIGRIISINHEECVGNVHQSHSFVRGNWGNSERSSTMLLQKSCHDMDILQWLIGKKCKSVHSFGMCSYFKIDNAPKDSPEYCIEGCPIGESCPYNAVNLYFDDKGNDWFRTTSTRMQNPNDDDVLRAIKETQYGKCVFKCDNDVVDHQTVNMLFEDDITVTFTMNAFNKGGRFIHVMGTKGELRAALEENQPIQIYDFEAKTNIEIPINGIDGINGGHGGGDEGIIKDLYEYLSGTYTGNSVPEIDESCYNHLLTFAVEESRISNKVIDVDNFIKNLYQ